MGSYVVRTDDISAVIARMEEEKGPAGRLVYSKELVDRLKEAKFHVKEAQQRMGVGFGGAEPWLPPP